MLENTIRYILDLEAVKIKIQDTLTKKTMITLIETIN